MKKIITESSVYYNGYGSYDCAENLLPIKPLKEIKKKKKKNAYLENLTTKKLNTGPRLCYNGYGSYDFPKIELCPMQISLEILYKDIAIIAIQHIKIILFTSLAIFTILLSEIHSSPSDKFPYTY